MQQLSMWLTGLRREVVQDAGGVSRLVFVRGTVCKLDGASEPGLGENCLYVGILFGGGREPCH